MTEAPSDRGTRLRWRALSAGALAAAVVVGGIAMSREVGVRSLAAPEAPGEVSGAWFCPHGGGRDWRVWVVVANPTDDPVPVRLVTYGVDRPARRQEVVEPGTHRFFEVPADRMASGSAVEFFGSPVAASMVASRRGAAGGVAAEPCLPEAGTRWLVADGTTLRGHEQRLVVVNPFAEQALFDVTLFEPRGPIRPGELSGIVVRPRRSVALNLGRFALGKPALAAAVNAKLGKVAVAGVGLTETSIRASIGAREPALGWVFPGGGDDAPSVLSVLNPGTSPGPFRGRAQGETGQAEVLSEAAVRAQRAAPFEVDAQGAGMLVESEGAQALVAARRLVRGDRLASTSGAAAAGTRWLAAPASPPGGAAALLVLQNPGGGLAEARISFLTADGPAQAPSVARVTLPSGRTRSINLRELFGEEPVAALVEVDRGGLIVAQAARSAGGYAMAMGVDLSILAGDVPM